MYNTNPGTFENYQYDQISHNWNNHSPITEERLPLQLESWPYPVKVYTLGQFFLLTDFNSSSLNIKSVPKKPIELLKCLIAFGGYQVSQEKIAETLWPDSEGDKARRTLDTTLFRLRKLLKHEQALVLKKGLLSLDSRYVWVDNWVLLKVLRQLEKQLLTPNITQVQALQHRLFNIYQGDFLGCDTNQSWSIVLKERLSNRMLKTFIQLGAFWQMQNQIDLAEICYEKGLGLNPLHEPIYQQLILLYINQGNQSQAVKTYEQCRKMLSTKLGVMPSEQTTAFARSLIVNEC